MKTGSNQTAVFKTNNWCALLVPILLCATACFFSVLSAEAALAINNGDFASSVPSNGSGNYWTSSHIDGSGGWTGNAFVLNDAGAGGTDPTLEQTISGLTIGNKYLISGEFLSVYSEFGSGSAYSFGVEISGMSVKEYQRPSGTGIFTYSFTATSTSHLLRLTAERNGDDSSYHVDNVSIEDAPTVSVAVQDDPAWENPNGNPTDKAIFRISRTGSTTYSLPVYFTTSGTAINSPSFDYSLSSSGTSFTSLFSPATIPAGSSSVDVWVWPWWDGYNDDNETAILNLSSNSAYSIGSPSSGTVTIRN